MASLNRIQDFDPTTYSLYFFDSNVWINILKNNSTNRIEHFLQSYIDFFEAIVNLNSISDPIALKKIKVVPKIVLTSLLISEIINAYMRNVAMKAYFNIDTSKKKFKNDYRDNPDSDYDEQLQIIIDDIKAYSFLYEYINDDFVDFDFKENIDTLSARVDFNDLYYTYLMKRNNITIVTHDIDFKMSDLNVLTANNRFFK